MLAGRARHWLTQHTRQFVEHLKECRKLLKKPGLEYITVAQEEYLLEVVSMLGPLFCYRKLTDTVQQRISESKIVPANWARINGTKVAYRYRSPRMQSLLEQRDQANERLAAEANNAFLAFLSAISAQYEAFRDGELRSSSSMHLYRLTAWHSSRCQVGNYRLSVVTVDRGSATRLCQAESRR